MAIYRLAQESRRQGLFPILLRITDIERYSDQLSTLMSSEHALSNAILLLDGLDEGLAVWRKSQSLPSLLARLMISVPTLVTSRIRDFEDSAQLDSAGITFEEIYELQPWDVNVEFSDFLSRLIRLGKLSDGDLLMRVANSVELQRIASRPLHARMLTFIYESDPKNPPRTQRELYSKYIQRLARVATVGLERRGCTLSDGVLTFWKEFAWQVYVNTSTSFDMRSLIRRTGQEHLECGLAAIDFIADRGDSNGYDSLEFLHYSFFEWLVATRIHDALANPDLTDEVTYKLLANDLPREIRHYLTAQLSPMNSQLSSRLSRTYKSLKARDADILQILVVGNLIVYLIARSSLNARSILSTLLKDEEEPFLANSLLWSLSHLGSREALNEFMNRYQRDREWREISRGYVLYYYGDLPIEVGPPYKDVEPYVNSDRSLARVMSMLEDPAQAADVAIERQAVDLLTILDIMKVRDICVTDAQLQTILTSMSRLELQLEQGSACMTLLTVAISGALLRKV